MIADRDNNRLIIVSPSKRIVWQYLQLPNGMIAATDDWNQRVVAIDPARKRSVRQYGHDGGAGSAPGFLHTLDGLDLVP
jgi:hypothetical protein